MKTLGIIAVLWILYSMYEAWENRDNDSYYFKSPVICGFGTLAWIIVFCLAIFGIFYLIITYLP